MICCCLLLSSCAYRFITTPGSVFRAPDSTSQQVTTLEQGSLVKIQNITPNGWALINQPVEGYIPQSMLKPSANRYSPNTSTFGTSVLDRRDVLATSTEQIPPSITTSADGNDKSKSCPQFLSTERRNALLYRTNITGERWYFIEAVRDEYKVLLNSSYKRKANDLGLSSKLQKLNSIATNGLKSELEHEIRHDERDLAELLHEAEYVTNIQKEAFQLDYTIRKELYDPYLGDMRKTIFDKMFYFFLSHGDFAGFITNNRRSKDYEIDYLLTDCDWWIKSFLPFCSDNNWTKDLCEINVGKFRAIVNRFSEDLLIQATATVADIQNTERKRLESLGYQVQCAGKQCAPIDR